MPTKANSAESGPPHVVGRALQFVFPIMTCGVLCVALLAQVWVHHRAVSLAYRISDLKAQRAQLISKRASLELELASLKTPNKLITAARLAHEMRQPRAEQIIKVKSKKRKANKGSRK